MAKNKDESPTGEKNNLSNEALLGEKCDMLNFFKVTHAIFVYKIIDFK